jgi:glycosyltransferase involved in cell wall biosynthesis
MWPFCGAEHCSWTERFKDGYRALGRNERRGPDLDRWGFRRKKKAFKTLPFQIVCPGTWLSGLVQESDLFRGRKVETIPNGLNPDEYDQLDQADCRRRLKLPLKKKLVLFGASSATAHHKGFDLFEKAVGVFRGNPEVELICFGGDFGKEVGGLKTHSMGVVSSSETIKQLYNAADVVCVPSRIESFGQVALEAMACGVPVVAFNATGLKDLVVHRKTGALAEPFSAQSLGEQIQWVLSLDFQSHRELREAARDRVVELFSHLRVAEHYRSLYERVVAEEEP